ncbi:hypothetical protein, partial [Slackia heliotrinireducens]|uniref:hypothetical protein n=1 Tax=Slackia heliotrinireducens TaxID=84110 RepID=UPI003314C38A
AESASPSDAESASPSDAAPASPSDAAPASPSDAESDSAKSESTASANNHTDDFTIVNVVRGEDDGYGYWDLEVTVQNNTDEEKNFLGFQIDELDANGNILNSYMSYNKNACETIVEPGQQFTIALTEETDDGIAGMQSRYCEWGDFSGEVVECEYSEKFKVMF